MAAAAVTLGLGVPVDAVSEALEEFRGVAHRLELVATHDGVRFYNDSKATNVASTLVALQAFAAPVHLIAGARDKGRDSAAHAKPVREHARAVYLMGEDAAAIAAALAPAEVPLHFCGDLE